MSDSSSSSLKVLRQSPTGPRQSPEEIQGEMFKLLRSNYDLTFGSAHGMETLVDLVERFDPIITPPPITGEQAMYVAGVRAVLGHINDLAGERYAKAMAVIARRSG